MSGTDSDHGDDGDPTEAKAADVVKTPASDVIDPVTRAKIAAWFDLPSFDQVEERLAAAAVPPATVSPYEEKQRKRKQTLEQIDPGLLAYLGRHAVVAEQLRRPTPKTRWEGRVIAFDDSNLPAIPTEEDQREVSISPALIKDLKNCTPQASLRDLHRPETAFEIVMRPAFEIDDEELNQPDPMEPVRVALKTDYRVGLSVPAAYETMTTAWASRKAILDRPWHESKRERARQREADLNAKFGWKQGKDGQDRAVEPEPEGTS